MTFDLPYPPSANRYWRHNRGIIHLSSEAKAYKQDAALCARAAGVRPLAGDVSITLVVYRPAKRGDLDNSLKVLIDSLRGIGYGDDKQIRGIKVDRHEDKRNPRVSVTLAPYEEVQP